MVAASVDRISAQLATATLNLKAHGIPIIQAAKRTPPVRSKYHAYVAVQSSENNLRKSKYGCW